MREQKSSEASVEDNASRTAADGEGADSASSGPLIPASVQELNERKSKSEKK